MYWHSGIAVVVRLEVSTLVCMDVCRSAAVRKRAKAANMLVFIIIEGNERMFI